jgi:hypothetical protein
MTWRTVVLDIPAKIVSIWFQLYLFWLAFAGIVTVTLLLWVAILATFGVRWGW